MSGLFIPIINRVWHLFLEPLGYPFRLIFAVVFFVIIMAYESILNLKIQKRVIILLSILGLLFLGQYYVFSNFINQFIFVNIVFIIIPIVLLLLGKKKLFSVMLIVELRINVFGSLYVYTDYSGTYSSYINHDLKVKSLLPDFGEYRMETTTVRLKLETIPLSNKAMIYGYRSLSGHSSIYNENYVEFSRKMGYEVWTFGVMYSSVNPFIDSLLGVKYIISNDIDFLECSSDSGLSLCENSFALPLSFVSKNDIDISMSDNAINNQNKISRSISNQDVYIELPSISKGIVNGYTYDGNKHAKNDSYLNKQEVIEVDVDEDDTHLFLYFENADISNVLSINTDLPTSRDVYINAGENNKIFYLGTAMWQNKVNITINQISDLAIYDDVKIYSLNTDALKSLEKLKESEITKGNNKLVFEAEEVSYMYVTIPVQEGMYIKGDRSQEVDSWLGCFYKIELLPGTNIISFNYIPKGLIVGSIISAATGIILIATLYLVKRKNSKTDFGKHEKSD